MAILLIINEKAGDMPRRAGFWLPKLEAAGIRPDEWLDLREGSWPKKLSPGDLVIVAGGDGSASSVAAECARVDCVLGLLPAGTANDFARSLGIPQDPDAACRVLSARQVHPVDLGLVGERPFLNVAHVGMGARVGTGVEAGDKRRWHHFSYAITLLRQLLSRRGFRGVVTDADGRRLAGRWLEIAVANGPSFGGGHRVYEATIDDGRLDLIGLRPKSLLQLVHAWVIARLSGKMPQLEAIERLRGRHFEIRTPRPCTVTADGEERGYTPVTFTILPGALKVLAPRPG